MLGIDLGSNTLRAVEFDEDFNKIKEFEFIIKSAQGLNENKKISKEAVERLKKALNEISKFCDLKSARAVATAAFRKAENTDEIFADLKVEFGVDFRVIDAKTEAKLSVLGMKMGLQKLGLNLNAAFCDLGGASCELSFKNDFQSFDFGIISFYEKASAEFEKRKSSRVNLNQEFFKKNCKKNKKLKLQSINDKKLRFLAFAALEQVKEISKKLRSHKVKFVVLNSGVPTNLAAFKIGLNYENYEASRINGMKFRANDFLEFALKIWKMDEKTASFWVGSMRKNYICAGALLLFALFEKQKLIVIDEGLREGVCLEN